MVRKIFHSFRFSHDAWRVQMIRNIGSVEGQQLLSANAWEDVQRKGDAAIRRWIDEQLAGRSCVVVLIGAQTSGRKWVNYEMRTGWADGKGVVGIHIHNLKDRTGSQAAKGRNPLSGVTVQTKSGSRTLSSVANTYDPPRSTSEGAYALIAERIEEWIEEAIAIRRAS